MVGTRRLAILGLTLLLLSALLLGMWRNGRAASVVTAQINGQVGLTLSLSADALTPGDEPLLSAQLSNWQHVTHTPQVEIALPAGFSVDPTQLAAGMSYDIQRRLLRWQPVVSANGGQANLGVTLRVETADIATPQKTITASLAYADVTQQTELPIWVGIPPQIMTVLDQHQAAVGQPVQLVPQLGGSAPFEQTWLLHDGRRVAVNEPELVFPHPGTFEIVLEVSNPVGTVTRTTNFTVLPHPAARFELLDSTLAVGEPLRLENLSGGDGVLTYHWEFGDGNSSRDATPIHIYAEPGSYQVKLTVSNQFGESEAFWPVTVGMPPTTAEIELADSTASGAVVVGQASGDDTVTTYEWDMGDGNVHVGYRARHAYRRSGDFYVTLTASNEFGSTQVGRWVRVEPGELSIFLPFVFQNEGGIDQPDPIDILADPLGLDLPPVALDEPFEMTPLDLPAGTTELEKLFLHVNEARQQFGLSPLRSNPALNLAAQTHALDMAAFGFTAHVGSDGSVPLERFIGAGYGGGYAGEATAWGFSEAHEAVEFWINSPAHRRIVLNQFVDELGVGFTVDYNAPNVWYWTAEFGDSFSAAETAAFRLVSPVPIQDVLNTTRLAYAWNWPAPLAEGQQFVLQLVGDGETISLGTVNQPTNGARYQLDAAMADAGWAVGSYVWQVALEDAAGNVLAVSPQRPISFVYDPDLPTPTPIVTPTTPPTATITPTPTNTPGPTSTPPPPAPTRPPLVTATPQPSP